MDIQDDQFWAILDGQKHLSFIAARDSPEHVLLFFWGKGYCNRGTL
jgi:hypothetical protein